MMKRYLPKNTGINQLAKELRKNMTKEERHLWYDFLHSYTPSFRRQFIVANYIVDFYCPSLKLAVELDGSQHYAHENIIKDTRRTDFLEACGIQVLRYTNLDIQQRFLEVCEDIDEKVKRKSNSML